MITEDEFRELKIGDRVLLTDLHEYSPAYRDYANREVIIDMITNISCLFIVSSVNGDPSPIFDLRDIEAIIHPDIKQDFDMQNLEDLLYEFT